MLRVYLYHVVVIIEREEFVDKICSHINYNIIIIITIIIIEQCYI